MLHDLFIYFYLFIYLLCSQVGIPGLGEKHRKKLGLRQLQQMNLASIQVLYNDLQTQIESKYSSVIICEDDLLSV